MDRHGETSQEIPRSLAHAAVNREVARHEGKRGPWLERVDLLDRPVETLGAPFPAFQVQVGDVNEAERGLTHDGRSSASKALCAAPVRKLVSDESAKN